VTNTGENGRWRLEESTFKERFSKDEFIFEKQGEGYKIYEKSRFSGTRFVKAKNFIPSDKAQQRTIELRDIFGNKPFGYPKPIPLIILLIKWINKSDAVILDFFAGSGTTGHAVLDLNRSEAKDGDLLNEKTPEGNRTFILCQLNEKTDTTPNGIAYDVTSKRLKRIMTGECYDGTKDFEWIKKNKPYGGNLDVYEIESVTNCEWVKGKTPFDVIDETLYGKEKFANIKEKIEWVCSNFDKTQKYLEQQKTEE
jgi:adenine-specific DNA-methyltransferase